MTKIDKPGVYRIDAPAYHADPCPTPSLSSSIGKLLVSPGGTPRHAWWRHPRLNPNYKPKHRPEFDIGRAAHSLMLSDPQEFSIIDADDYRAKDAKAQRDAAYESGKIPLLVDQWDRVNAMVIAGKSQLSAHKDARDAFGTGGIAEQTIIWLVNGVWCRGRPDWACGNGIWDYKTTGESADPDVFGRQLFAMGYDFQAAFYMRGVRALGIADRPEFKFVVQETEPPYLLSVIGLSPQAIELAERDVDRAIKIWGDCLRTNNWPGYPLRTCYVDSPPWREAQKMEREQRNDAVTREEIEAANKAQEPL